jgi:hypothetical protein
VSAQPAQFSGEVADLPNTGAGSGTAADASAALILLAAALSLLAAIGFLPRRRITAGRGRNR